MWYTTCSLNTLNTSVNTPLCRQCNSPLVFVEKTTQKLENSHFETTTTIYKCSNQACQDDIDKKAEQRKKLAQDQADAREKRVKANLAQKQKKEALQA